MDTINICRPLHRDYALSLTMADRNPAELCRIRPKKTDNKDTKDGNNNGNGGSRNGTPNGSAAIGSPNAAAPGSSKASAFRSCTLIRCHAYATQYP